MYAVLQLHQETMASGAHAKKLSPAQAPGSWVHRQSPSCWRQCLQQSCLISPSSLTCEMNMGAGSDVGCSLRAEPQAGPSLQGSSAPHCLEQLGAGMSHLVGSHLQSLLLKQFHFLGGRKTGHQLCVSEEGAGTLPLTPTGPEQRGPRRTTEKGSKVTLWPGLAQPRSASSAWGS